MLKKIYTKVPTNLKANISKVSYLLGNRPKALPDQDGRSRFPGNEKGGVIISADFELGWAVRYSKQLKDPVKFAMRERYNIPIILEQLEKYDIPIVWATVGHLFLRSCHKGDHDWMRRIPHFDDHWRFTKGDWFDCDPCSGWEDAKAWYAPDLIEKILNSRVHHEMACHTFSHIDCSYKNCPPEVLDDEIQATVQLAAQWGVAFTSMTFPGGTAGNYEILLKHGIKICRKRHLDFEIAYPFYNQQGMLISPTGPIIAMGYAQWSPDYLFSRFVKAIDKAIRRHSVVHFWFHPSQSTDTFTGLLPRILHYCQQKREQGLLWVGGMTALADHIARAKGSSQ